MERLAKGLKLKTNRLENMRLFNSNGMELYEADMEFIKDKEVIYVSMGEEFDVKSYSSEYETIKELGAGGFGKVVLAQNKSTGQKVAIKYTYTENIDTIKDLDSLYSESQTLKCLKHPNIVSVLNCYVDRKSKQAILIMEYLEGGELLEHVQQVGRLPEEEAREIFNQLVSAISYCHQQKIIHRDLKLENILRVSSTSPIYKIVDFGIAGLCSGFKAEPTNAGSLNYMAPEVFLTKNCGASPALDIWALGCILYTMVVGKLPFKADKVAEVKQRILHDPVIFPKDIELSDEVKDLTARMLDKDPETRASVFEINESAWKNKRKFTEEEKERIKEREAAVRAKLLEEQMKLNREREEENVKKGSLSPTKKNVVTFDRKPGMSVGTKKKDGFSLHATDKTKHK